MTDTSYDSYWRHRSASGNRFRYNIFVDWVVPDTSVLDAGCGDGFLGGRLVHERHCTVTGMDVSSVALDRARERGLRVVQGSLEGTLPFPDNSFEYVIASEAIEHIVHSEEALKEFYRVAAAQSLFLCPTVPTG